MPRAKRVPSSPARQLHERLWAEVAGAPLEYSLADWDPNAAQFLQAVLEIVNTGASVFIRPGSGGRALGIAIWEGDDRYPATWFSEFEELDAWTKRVVEQAEGRAANAAEKTAPNGA